MKKFILTLILSSILPGIVAAEEKKMRNTNPSSIAKPEHTMRNTNPSPVKVPEHMMKNTNPNASSSNDSSGAGATKEPVDIQNYKQN